jgi:long-chain acyl-CoA synthetase
MQGYLKMPKQTSEVIDKDGWFHTGDIGHLDDDGYLFITDRKKELFKLSTGKYVAPAPIENRLIASPYVEQVVIVGNSRKFCGAIILPAMEMIDGTLGEDVSEEKIHALITEEVVKANEGLPNWEQVKKFALITEPMTIETGELTPTMKRKRAQINECRKAEIDFLYA